MTRRTSIAIVAVVGLLAGYAVGEEAEFSQLWGQDGERWAADSRLPDFCYCGSDSRLGRMAT